MTYGVPYSFVPGTKAKAEEVNANFIAVLDKIEETNTKIENSKNEADQTAIEFNEKFENIEETLETKMKNDFSDLSEEGEAFITEKLDGSWVISPLMLAYQSNISSGQIITFDLSTYLPNDTDDKYIVCVDGWAVTNAAIGSTVQLTLSSDIHPEMFVATATTAAKSSMYDGFFANVIIGAGKKLYVKNSASAAGKFILSLSAYRKVK